MLTDSMEIAGVNQLEGMVTQLRNATSIASRGESPVLAVTSAMGTAERAALRDLLVSRGLGNVEVVFLPEAEILGAGRRLRTAMGF